MKKDILLLAMCLSLALNLAFGGLYAYRRLSPSPKAVKEKMTGRKQTKPTGLSGKSGLRCILDELNLNAKQQKRLSAMRVRIWKKRARFHARADGLRRSVARAISEDSSTSSPEADNSGRQPVAKARPNGVESVPDNPTRKRIARLVSELSRLQAGFRMQVADHLLAVKKMLNEKQRAHFARLLDKRIFTGMRRFRNRERPQVGRP